MTVTSGMFTAQSAAAARAAIYQSGAIPLIEDGIEVLRAVPLDGVVEDPLGDHEALGRVVRIEGSQEEPRVTLSRDGSESNFHSARAKLQGLIDEQVSRGARIWTNEIYASRSDVDEFLRRLTVIHDVPLRDLLQRRSPKGGVEATLRIFREENWYHLTHLEHIAKELYELKTNESWVGLESLPGPDYIKGAHDFFKHGVLYAALDDPVAMDISAGQFDAAGKRFLKADDPDASALSRILAMEMRKRAAGLDAKWRHYSAAAAVSLYEAIKVSEGDGGYFERFVYGLLCAGCGPNWSALQSLLKQHFERGNRNPSIMNIHMLKEWAEFEAGFTEANRGRVDPGQFHVSAKLLGGSDSKD